MILFLVSLEVCPNTTLPSSLTFTHIKIKTLEWYLAWKLNLLVGLSMWLRELIWLPCVFMGDEHPVSCGDVSICLKTDNQAMLIKKMSFVDEINYWFAQGSSKCPKEDVLDSWNESSSSSEFLSNYRDEQLKIILRLSSDSISKWTSSLVLRCIKVLATSQFTAGNWTGSRQDTHDYAGLQDWAVLQWGHWLTLPLGAICTQNPRMCLWYCAKTFLTTFHDMKAKGRARDCLKSGGWGNRETAFASFTLFCVRY